MFDYKDWYAKNKGKLGRKKAIRYRRDSEYQKGIRLRMHDRYHGQLKKPGIPDRQVIKTEDDRLFTIGKIGHLISRDGFTIRNYHKQGIIPPPTYYDSRGWRLYDRNQANILQLTFRKFDRGELRNLREVKKEIASQWK